jgi:hypothetical protein
LPFSAVIRANALNILQKKMPEIRAFFARYGLPGGGGS